MTQKILDKLEKLQNDLVRLKITTEATKNAIEIIRDNCNHMNPDGTDARTYDSDGAYCHICERLVHP